MIEKPRHWQGGTQMQGRNPRPLLIACVALSALGSASQAAPAIPDAHRAKLASPVHRLLSTAKPQCLIIQLQETAPPDTYTQLKKAGAKITRRYEFLPMVAARVPGKSIAAVAALPGVTRVSLDTSLSVAAR